MHCQNCGAEVAAQSVYCHQCGRRLDQPAAGGAERFTSPAGRTPEAANSDATLWEGTYCLKAMYGSFLACAALSIAILVAGIVLLAALPIAILAAVLVWLWPLGEAAYRKLAARYRLTPQRFFHERGILKRVTDRIEVIDMDDITYEQGIVQRLLGVGTIRITSSDRTHPALVLRGIDDVARVAGLIDDARRAERNRRGVYIESV